MNIIILANKSNQYGLHKDVAGIRKVLGGYTVKHCDPLEPPVAADILIHLEVPAYGWAPWGRMNILMVNPEHWESAWDTYLPKFDTVITRDEATATAFSKKGADTICIPWGLAPPEIPSKAEALKNEFVWVLAGSVNKRAYVPTLLQAWRSTYPKLTITTTAAFDLSGVELGANIQIINKDLSPEERQMFKTFKGHVCCSRAEGFGYTAAEAEQNGSFAILNSLPCYVSDYSASPGVAFLPSKLEGLYDVGAPLEDLQGALDKAMREFTEYSMIESRIRQGDSKKRWLKFYNKFASCIKDYVMVLKSLAPPKSLPPRLETCPPISIVTLIYNRKKFFDLACHSLMISDYPKDKIEWIIVDDSDDPMEQNSDTIVSVANTTTSFKIVYVPLTGKRPISDKRNIGVDKATSNVILFMDDDDHYPETSIRRRVGWLTAHPWAPKAVACTTIACYDLVKGISAVNVPPMDIPLEQRISEATLTFYKSWWAEKPFPRGIQVGEGEGFLTGRSKDILEMPPQQIIVAFSHGRNVSSRRVPSGADVTPGCFWGFQKEFLVFIHGLAGISVVQS
jgi:hypothetical protein